MLHIKAFEEKFHWKSTKMPHELFMIPESIEFIMQMI